MQPTPVQLHVSNTYPLSDVPESSVTESLAAGSLPSSPLVAGKRIVYLYPQNWYHRATGRNLGGVPQHSPEPHLQMITVCLKPADCTIGQHEISTNGIPELPAERARRDCAVGTEASDEARASVRYGAGRGMAHALAERGSDPGQHLHATCKPDLSTTVRHPYCQGL